MTAGNRVVRHPIPIATREDIEETFSRNGPRACTAV
jgi:hypothetical protein